MPPVWGRLTERDDIKREIDKIPFFFKQLTEIKEREDKVE